MGIVTFIIVLLYEIAIILFAGGICLEWCGLDVIGLFKPNFNARKSWYLMYSFTIMKLTGIVIALFTSTGFSFIRLLESLSILDSLGDNFTYKDVIICVIYLLLFLLTFDAGNTILDSIKEYKKERKEWE
jgi:succinate dehydrogenase hydrophobic anchor subunit